MLKDGIEYKYLDVRLVIAVTNDTADINATWEFIFLDSGTTLEEGIKAVREEWERRKEGNTICIDLHRAVIETSENGDVDIFNPDNPFHPEYKGLRWPEEIKEEGFALFSIDSDGEHMKEQCKGIIDINYMVLELNKAYDLASRFLGEGLIEKYHFYTGYAKGVSKTLGALGVKLTEKEDGTIVLS